ncbi:MAG: hypothetical protein CMP07_10375 [Xanthomonadales bacterium]|nr:hypothetical protein [Xanthomonadales bacterium]
MSGPELQDFEGIVGDQVSLEAGELAVEASVHEVGKLPSHGDRQSFSVVFRSEPGPQLEQQIVRVRHERLGELDLFLVPLGPAGDGMDYEAVFN